METSKNEISAKMKIYLQMSYATLILMFSINAFVQAQQAAEKLEIIGAIRIVDNTEGSGKVLTSDGSGLARWMNPVEEFPENATVGDILIYDGSSWVKKSIGNEGQVLTVFNGALEWKDPNVTQYQVLNISNDTISITGGNFIVIPGLRYVNRLLTVQERLDYGETPCQIYHSGINYDSLIGKLYQGGLIFMLDVNSNSCEGLVAAPFDQSSSAVWGCYGTDLPIPNVLGYPPAGPGAEIGDGEANTVGIDTASCSISTDAAVICADLVLNGFEDWFLPSIKELNLMRNVLYIQGLGNLDDGTYWSSTEATNTISHHVEFLSGVPYSGFDKNNMLHVRAIRSIMTE